MSRHIEQTPDDAVPKRRRRVKWEELPRYADAREVRYAGHKWRVLNKHEVTSWSTGKRYFVIYIERMANGGREAYGQWIPEGAARYIERKRRAA